jgi:hypothetical protein
MRRGLFLALILAAAAARAQEIPPDLPPAPPPAPPPPPSLAPAGAPIAPQAPPAGLILPPGIEALPGGALRLSWGPAGLDAAQRQALRALGRSLAALPAGRVTVEAQVSGPAHDISAARRESLARAQAVRAALIEGGLDARRIDLKPLGRVGAGADRVDVLPPGVASPEARARGR